MTPSERTNTLSYTTSDGVEVLVPDVDFLYVRGFVNRMQVTNAVFRATGCEIEALGCGIVADGCVINGQVPR